MSQNTDKYWWNVLSTVSSFLWDSSEREELSAMASEGAPVKNKSALYNILAANQAKDAVKKQTEEKTDEVTDIQSSKENVSSLYKIISSQNLTLKDPEELKQPEDFEGIEYHEISENPVENSHFEQLNQEAVAENALYFVECDKVDAVEEPARSERKTSLLEINLTQPAPKKCDQMRPQSTPDAVTLRQNEGDEIGNLASISFSFLDERAENDREFTYDVVDDTKIALNLQELGYVPMNEGCAPEAIYSSPRSSVATSREVSPGYVGPDPAPTQDELFYAASEVMTRRPTTPFGRKSSRDDYEDVDLEDRELPPLPSSAPEPDPENYVDVDVEDYCRHRDTFPRKIDTLVKGKTVNLVKVKSRLNRAWRSVKSIIHQEKDVPDAVLPKIPEPLPTESEIPESPYSCLSENSDYFSERSKPSADDCSVSMSDVDIYADMSVKSENGLTTLLRRGRDISGAASPFRKSRIFPEGQNGFEDLRRYIKQGEDFCKELSAILHERSEAETQYAKSLSKLSGKLLKTSREAVGGVAEAWQLIGAEMEAQSDIHRAFAAALTDDVVRPLKSFVDKQHRVRKHVEGAVDKTAKSLSEWRQAENKSKKQSFLSARENEKLQDAMLEVRNSKNNASNLHLHHQKQLTEKESAKMDIKRKKAEDCVKKADVEYYTVCVRAERARLEWETAVTRGSHSFQTLEEERLSVLKGLAQCYLSNFRDIGPRLTQCCERLSEPVDSSDPGRDIQTVISLKGTGAPSHDQLLPDFYAEHITLAMNRERRRQALAKILQLIRQDIDRERRGKQGVENLQRAMLETPTFGGEDSQNDVDDKLYHMKAMLLYLEASRYKVQAALAELDGRPRPPHPLAGHIQVTRDRQGLQQSLLKVPTWARMDNSDSASEWCGREAGDGTSALPDSDFDEFSSVGSDKDYQTSVYNDPIISEMTKDGRPRPSLGECKALYPYSPKLFDELNLEIGDVITVHEKQSDGWWLGELRGVVGIFPATYVEEIN